MQIKIVAAALLAVASLSACGSAESDGPAVEEKIEAQGDPAGCRALQDVESRYPGSVPADELAEGCGPKGVAGVSLASFYENLAKVKKYTDACDTIGGTMVEGACR